MGKSDSEYDYLCKYSEQQEYRMFFDKQMTCKAGNYKSADGFGVLRRQRKVLKKEKFLDTIGRQTPA